MFHRAATLAGIIAATAASLWPQGSDARVISNVADARWDAPEGSLSVRSNPVDITVRDLTPEPPAVGLYRIGPQGSGIVSRLDEPGCVVGGIASPLTTAQNPADSTVGLIQSGSFVAGEALAVGVRSAGDNRDPAARDRLTVELHLENGDVERVTLREDADNSGFFVGYVMTARIPPALARHDCRLSVAPGDSLRVSIRRPGESEELASALVGFLVDPFGIVFDSGDGSPVPGARVTLVDAASGQPAQVFGDDGISAFPSSIVTGSTVTDASGAVYDFPAGDYRFPFVAPGAYRLVVEPPEPYRAPSSASIAEMAGFSRPDNGAPYTLNDASFGAVFQLLTPAPVRIDIPVDRPATALTLRKQASTPVAVPGENILYRIELRNGDTRRTTGALTVTDDMPRAMRLRAETLRWQGEPVVADIAPDGSRFAVSLPPLAAGASGLLTYVAEVRPDARPGDANNIASARDNRGGQSNVADAAVRIRRDLLGDRITIIGRITAGGCTIDPGAAPGVAGVRVMMQDGSFTVTDSDGRYHFEGVRPGLSVVQIDPASLPAGQAPVDCARNTRSAGSAISRFVEGRGGELKRADFHVSDVPAGETPATPTLAAPARPAVAEDRVAAGGEADFFAGQAPGIDWLFPAPEHNPRAPTLRIAIKHLPGQRVELLRDGRPVDPLSFEGVQNSPDGGFRVSLWRGVSLSAGANRFTARVIDANGALVQELARTVSYSGGAMQATLLRDQSLLVADGIHRPVVAVRLTDRNGRPVRHGTIGDLHVAPPHRAAQEIDAEQARQLAGLDAAPAHWRVEGDDGIAHIELDPTTASGAARIEFAFRDEQVTRRQQLDLWLNPGDRPWTIVGFAAGTIGYNTLDDRMEDVAEDLASDHVDGRIALYAKGRILGQWLMTMSYDSDKESDDTRFGGVIDPRAYYTIYADRADRGFDAASVRNLYLRLERPQFYALFGDFETGFHETELARYQRSMNGLRAEYRGPVIGAAAFVADTPYRHRRDEMQGNGLSGPYQLDARDILANSERVEIEVRDRLRSNIVIERRALTRHIDYDIDYFAGTLRFREPVLSRDPALNPQFIVANYEVDGVGERVTNAGARLTLTAMDEALRIGATAISDGSDTARSAMGGMDLRFRADAATEIRAEYARSNADPRTPGQADAPAADAWLIEVEHHGATFDILAYVREREAGFGVGQLTGAGDGSRRFGFDGKLRLDRDLSLIASSWQEDFIGRDARRRAARLLGEWRTADTTLRAGLTHADDSIAGESNRSTLVQLGATQRLFGQRLELDAQTEFALGGNDESVDFPARHRLSARYALTQGIAITGAYEIADGGDVDARTARIGFDARPWDGGRLVATGNRQDSGEYGPRSYAAYGLAQSWQVNERVTIDATLDGQRTLSGIRARDVMDPAHPVASGGFLDGSGALTEDFTAVTAGANYRTDDWTITGRAEYRDGELANRYGLTLGGIRRIGEGRAFGGMLTWARAKGDTVPSTATLSAELSWAHRPADSRWSFLEKLEWRIDSVTGAVAGQPGPIGGPALAIDGDARSRRVINSLSINYTPTDRDRHGNWLESGEYTLFWGTRHTFDRFGRDDVKGWSNVIGADLRFDLGQHVGIGLAGTVRLGTDARALGYGGGPQIVLRPMENANLVLGYNFAGFRDRDFEESRYSRGGVYATFRLKFDQTSFAGLGL